MAPIQKAIRDLQRSIKRKTDKGESTEALDKKLALLFDDKTISDQIQKEKRNSAKYHMIKFIERQKLVRKIRSIDQQLTTTTANIDKDSEKLNSTRDGLLEQLAYVMYYPKEFKYVALFADSGEKGENGESVKKNEKLRLKAHKTAVAQWKNDKLTGAQDRVMRVILCEDKEEVVKSVKSSGKKRRGDDDDDDDNDEVEEEEGVTKRMKSKDVVTYGDKVILPKKKKSKTDNSNSKNVPEKEEEVIDFPAGQAPDSFFLEEEIIESKMSALQSINQKYPPEKGQKGYSNNYSNNNYKNNNYNNRNSNPTASYGNYGPGLQNKDKKVSNFAPGKKPAYGAGSFSSFTPTKQSARLQKWQQRKGAH